MLSLYIIVVAIAYLLGSIPFGYLLVRIFRGEDIRLTGSGKLCRIAPGPVIPQKIGAFEPATHPVDGVLHPLQQALQQLRLQMPQHQYAAQATHAEHE